MNVAARVTAVLSKLTTEADNVTPDLLRYIALFGVLVFLGLSIATWEKFDPVNFGIGLGSVLLAASGAVRINEGAPKPTPESTS